MAKRVEALETHTNIGQGIWNLEFWKGRFLMDYGWD
jgi:hypothetical protein